MLIDLDFMLIDRCVLFNVKNLHFRAHNSGKIQYS